METTLDFNIFSEYSFINELIKEIVENKRNKQDLIEFIKREIDIYLIEYEETNNIITKERILVVINKLNNMLFLINSSKFDNWCHENRINNCIATDNHRCIEVNCSIELGCSNLFCCNHEDYVNKPL